MEYPHSLVNFWGKAWKRKDILRYLRTSLLVQSLSFFPSLSNLVIQFPIWKLLLAVTTTLSQGSWPCSFHCIELVTVLLFRVWTKTPCKPRDCSPPGLFCSWDFPGKNTGVSCYFLLQGIFLTQGWDPCFLTSPALAGRFFTTAPLGKPVFYYLVLREPLVSLKYGFWVSLQGLAVLFEASWGYAKGTGSHGNLVWIFIQMNTCCHCSLSILYSAMPALSLW